MPQATFSLGRIAGIRIGAHWSVLVVMVLLADILARSVLPAAAGGLPTGVYWAMGFIGSLLFLISLLAHEMAHSLVARHYGIEVDRITLWMLGGASEITEELPSARSEGIVAVAGPLSSLVISATFIGLVAVLSDSVPVVIAVGLLWLGWTNLLLALFNLLPAAPLDGGRVLSAIVWKITGSRQRAHNAAAKAGQVLGFALVIGGLTLLFAYGRFDGLWLAFIGWFLSLSAKGELIGGRVREALKTIRVGEIMVKNPVFAPGWLTVQGFIDTVATKSRHRCFPVVDFTGTPIGTISLLRLTAVPEQNRMKTTIADICVKPPQCRIVSSTDSLISLLGKVSRRVGQDLILVVDEGTLTGVVSFQDLNRAVELASLGAQEAGKVKKASSS